jgi:hypothetical protein
LNEATAFESAETYGGSKQTYQGRRYTFRFPEGNVMFTLSAASEIAALDGVLAQARAGGGAPDAALPLLPEGGGAKNPPGGRAFTDPLGAFWLAVAGILLLIFFACLVLGRLARSFAA